MKPITCFPEIDVRTLRESTPPGGDPILDHPRLMMFSSCRAALHSLFLSLRLEPGQKVLFPSFHCGVEVEAALQAHGDVDFFGVDEELRIDTRDLAARIDSDTRAIVIVHYFGFPQDIRPVRELCHDGVLLIEDSAHALYSRTRGQALGLSSDAGVFSFAKTLPLPNGGGAVLSHPALQLAPATGRGAHWPLLRAAADSMLACEIHRGSRLRPLAELVYKSWKAVSGRARTRLEVGAGGDPRFYSDARYRHGDGIWWGSGRLLRAHNPASVVKTRRRNYRLWLESVASFHSIKPIFEELPAGVCPLCFPVRTDSRDEVARRLLDLGVEPFIFGKIPHRRLNLEEFPESRRLSDSILCLPVHQQLTESDIASMAHKIAASVWLGI